MRFLRSLLLLALLAPALALGHSGSYVSYSKSWSTSDGTAVTSDVIDARDLESLTIASSAVTTNRSLTVSCIAADGTTALFSFPAITVTAATGPAYVVWNPHAVVMAAAPTGVVYYATNLCPKVQASLAAAGAAAARIDITGRRQQVAASVQVLAYESGSVIAGAAISSGVIDTRRVDSLMILVEATTTGRALVLSCTDSAGTALFSFASFTVTAGSKFLNQYRINSLPTLSTDLVAVSEVTGVLHVPAPPCNYMKADVAAAGAASAKLAVYARN